MANIKTDELGQFHEYGVYVSARIIECFGEIDQDKANQVIRNIRLLDFSGDKDITLLVNTPGGDVHQGLAIIDSIKECQSKVIGHAVGPCWSMGAAILQSSDERLISQNATLMIHEGQNSVDEHAQIAKRWIAEYERVGDTYEDILYHKIKEKDPKFTKAKLKKMLAFDTIFTAEKAVELGLADKILDHKEIYL